MKRVFLLFIAVMILVLPLVPSVTVNAAADVVDDCSDIGAVFEKSGTWNIFTPHPDAGRNVYGKQTADVMSLTYRFENLANMTVKMYGAAPTATGVDYMPPLYRLSDTVFGAKIYISSDNSDWKEISFNAVKGEETGHDVSNTFYEWILTPKKNFPAGTAYIKIALGNNPAWALFFGGITLTETPGSYPASLFDFEDKCEDWSMVFDKTANWKPATFDAEVQRDCFGKTNGLTGSLTYRFPDAKNGELYFYAAYNNSLSQDTVWPSFVYGVNPDVFGAKIYASPDNTDSSWALIPYDEVKGAAAGTSGVNTWYKWTVTPQSDFPAGTEYIKIVMNNDASWSMHFGGIGLDAYEGGGDPPPPSLYDLEDNCQDFSKTFSVSSNMVCFAPDSEVKKNVFGKTRGVIPAELGTIVYELEDIKNYALTFYCAHRNSDGTDWAWPSFVYPPDDPTVFGVRLFASADNVNFEPVDYYQAKGEAAGTSDNGENTWYNWQVTPKANLGKGYKYLKIEIGTDAPWTLYFGGIKATAYKPGEDSNEDELAPSPITDTKDPNAQFIKDNCTDYSKVHSKTAGWETKPGNELGNPWTPHPEIGKNCFGKNTATSESLVYNLNQMQSFDIRFYCANNGDQDLAWPTFVYPPDDPKVFGAKLYTSADGNTWKQISYNEAKLGKAGGSGGTSWYEWRVTKASAFSANYLKIEVGTDATWTMFVGAVNLYKALNPDTGDSGNNGLLTAVFASACVMCFVFGLKASRKERAM